MAMLRLCSFGLIAFLLGVNSGQLWSRTLPDDVVTEILQGASELRLGAEGTSVPLSGTPTLPLVEVDLNGTFTARFLIDLGADVVIVRQDVLERGGGTVLFAREPRDVGQFASFVIGAAEYRYVTVGVWPELDVDGVIGYNLLRHSSFTIDYPGRRFSLHHRRLPDPETDPDVLTYDAEENLPMIRIALDGKPITVNLDTGASEWMTVPPDLADRLPWSLAPVPGPELTNNQTGVVRVLEGRAAGTLVLGPLEIETPPVYVNEDAEYPWLGSAAMNSAVWTFDPRNHRLLVEIPAARREGRRRINGTQLYVKVLGQGEPLIVIHGGPGWDHSILLPHLEPLADSYRLILFDQRASGRSSVVDVDDADMTIDRMLGDIDGVRRHFGLEKVALLGHSFGGRLAMQYALKYPDRLLRLILVSSTAASSEYFDRVNQTIQDRMTAENRQARDRLIAAGALTGEPPESYRDLMRLFLGANFHDPAKVDRLDLYVPDHFSERGARSDALSAGSTPYDFYADLPRIRVPTLILRGASEALPMEATRRLHEQIPGSRLVVLKECGHFPFAECPGDLLAAIRRWGSAPAAGLVPDGHRTVP